MCSVLVALVLLAIVSCVQSAVLGLQTQNDQAYGQGDLVRAHPLGLSSSVYEIVTPLRLNSAGEIVSHGRHFRRRREVEDLEDWNSEAAYVIEAFGRQFHLELQQDGGFIAGSFVLQYLGDFDSGNSTDDEEYHDDTVSDVPVKHCFYSGHVDSHQGSKAVFSLCAGLFGTFRTENGTQYFIEPLGSVDAKEESIKQHIIYKHEDLTHSQHHNSTSICGLQDRHHQKENHGKRTEKENSLFEEYSQETEDSLVKNSTRQQSHRKKRSISYERHVETMVVVDSKMYAYHGKNLEHYVLTLMALVNSIYKHASIGNFVNIVVVKVLVIKDEKDGPPIYSNAATTLSGFCSWQQTQNKPDDNDPLHADTAVLLTRQDICFASNKCDTLGLAELGTVCDPYRSCSIVEDNGLSAAFTIAHEIGHVLNIPHDDSLKCKNQKGKHHVMAPTLHYNTNPWSWSECSRHELTEFLDLGLGHCLLDKPKSAMELPNSQPGSDGEYPVNRQCELIFGNSSTVCHYMKTCRRLWCKIAPSGVCITQHMPWADGTTCGDGKSCQRGECVNSKLMPHRPKVNGGWGSWGKYTECSRTCGGGVKASSRNCTHPAPQNGGKYCLGRRTKFRSCNTKPCPAGQPGFREKQCSEYNGRHFNLNELTPNVSWVPKYSGIHLKDRCKLFCRVSGSTSYYMLDNKIKDGTPCGSDTDDICVQGLCRKAGCDHVLNSKTRKDFCGVCGGDSTSCRAISNTYNTAQYGYNTVVRIPSGANNIDIRQHGYDNRIEDDNYLALMNSKSEYILNGQYSVSLYRRLINVGGATLEYSGSAKVTERINCSSTIHEDILLQVLSVGSLYPPNISYTYTIPIPGTVVYVWDKYGPWKPCSAICNGVKQRRIRCVRPDDRAEVSHRYCNAELKPNELTSRCNTKCYLSWSITEGECSARCGKGQKTRTLNCIKVHQRNSVHVASDHCKDLDRPPETVECEGDCPPSHWEFSDWSTCSVSCGGGVMTRDAECQDAQHNLLDDSACEASGREVVTSCNQQDCPIWKLTEWSACSVTCGLGQRLRHVLCHYKNERVSTSLCDSSSMPSSTQQCEEIECPVWDHSPWGPCSVSCGRGYQVRAVVCRFKGRNGLGDDKCNAALRPINSQDCNMSPCPVTVTPTVSATHILRMASRSSDWRTGDWTPCSKTCGVGTRERYVSCLDPFGTIVDESYCDMTVKPAQKENCEIQPCPFWRTGEWIPCPVTCGTGSNSRYVACVYHDGMIGNDADCDQQTRPVHEQMCNTNECQTFPIAVISDNRVTQTSQWRVGPWSSCSSSCGHGNRRRAVVCQDHNGENGSCDESVKPEEQTECDSGPCPTWNYGEWGVCSKSCGSGNKSRMVQCQLRNGQTLEDNSCDFQTKPVDTVPCNVGECPSESQWFRGQWSRCSATCGRGYRFREVYCQDFTSRSLPDEFCNSEKPKQVRGCKITSDCPKWRTNPWTKCSVTCGEGLKSRSVVCERKHNREVSVELCDPRKKPLEVKKCSRQECVTYTWRTGKWSQCTKSCGGGQRHRVVHCVNGEDKLAEDVYCKKRRPRDTKHCKSQECPVPTWTSGEWSECSRTCGEGHQTRNVTCQAFSEENLPIPGEVSGCDPIQEPESLRPCNIGQCQSDSFWRTGSWSVCSRSCGVGVSQRIVVCQEWSGKSQPDEECAEVKPESVKSCDMGPCLPRSCHELKWTKGISEDGEYLILIGDRTLSVYCHNMMSSVPLEFLTLPAGEAENYSEIYPKSLIVPHQCPYNGNRNDNCECTDYNHPQSGFTAFSKLRLDVHTMSVITSDDSFIVQKQGEFIPYATAGDCYSLSNCPQGRFHINLSGTGLAVSTGSSWDAEGRALTRNIFREKNGQIIRGSCGGYCGKCFPDSRTGLKLTFTS